MKFVTRSEWGARPARSPATSIYSEGTTGHWEGGSLWGGVIGDHASCASKVRAIQAYHMDHQGWSDIAYNALYCPHGYVFEGRGPGRRSAANGTNSANGRSAVACYLGGEGDPFTLEAKEAALDAANYLEGDLIWGHRDWYNTRCPGDEIYGWIQAGHPMPESVPVPQVPVTPPNKDDKVLLIVQQKEAGPDSPWFLTDGLFRRQIKTKDQAVQLVRDIKATGGLIGYDPGADSVNPVIRTKAEMNLDDIPLAG